MTSNVVVSPLIFGGNKVARHCRDCGKPLPRRSGKNVSGFCCVCHAKQMSREYWENYRKAKESHL
jgi:uncharacterized Zn finger protein (UPF0148 family)